MAATTSLRWMTATRRSWPGSRVATSGRSSCFRAVICRPCSGLPAVFSATQPKRRTSRRKPSCGSGRMRHAGNHWRNSGPGSRAWSSISVSTASGVRPGSNWRRPAISSTRRRSAGEKAESDEREQMLAAAIEKLPARQRSAIVLTYGEGMSNAQVAEILDTSVSAVETLLVRGQTESAPRTGRHDR